jgi:trafficking protein particle complex subunit 8
MITHATYEFLSLLHSTESLSSRGPRLQDTSGQRQKPTYAPDVIAKVIVEETSHKLLANFVDDDRLALAQGETKSLSLWFSNTGANPIDEIWLVSGPEDEIWVSAEEDPNDTGENTYLQRVRILRSNPGRIRNHDAGGDSANQQFSEY